MAQPGESDSKGKAVVVDLEEPKEEYECPSCFKIFNSTPALCGHQNAHRLLKEPMKMSPVLAAVLNNPLPPFHKPFLIPPKTKPAANKELISKQPTANQSPRHHPYKRHDEEANATDQLQDKLMKQTTQEGEDFLRQLIRNEAQYEYNDQEEYTNTDTQCLTMDLLGEWMPISGFGDDGHHLCTPRKYPMEMERETDLQIGLSATASTGDLDLELKLGF
ncbi:hypothetical protein Golob_022120 [Gossypium lobatum]|uniref:C2H2-type domain-containing protein n=1 Tax=Gossypium lobatum TaxID=34289 RepID=A0A7J8LFK6_9ROSI|nr:hypothetical protein [Gossypium lobatum]